MCEAIVTTIVGINYMKWTNIKLCWNAYTNKIIILQINKHLVLFYLSFLKNSYFSWLAWLALSQFHYLRVYVRALPRSIWLEFVGNIYDLAFTAKLTLIWSQALIYDLPVLINVQLQLKMQHLHFAVSASAIRINMYTHLQRYTFIQVSYTLLLRSLTSKFEKP